MKTTWQDTGAACIPLVLLLGLVGSAVWNVVSRTGQLVYPLDDPYIHLAMARHFTDSGTFGVSLSGFSASSSSPGWTLLLSAGYGLIGQNDWLPLALNLFAGAALTVILYRFSCTWCSSPWLAAIVTSAIVLCMPLAPLVLLGMEHTLHCLAVLALMLVLIRSFDPEAPHPPLLLVGFLAAATTALRYESGFLIAPAVVLLMLHHRWSVAATLLAGCAIPVVSMGLVQLTMGWYFFPSSILHKSVMSQTGMTFVDQVSQRLYGQFFGNPHLVILWIPVLILLWQSISSANTGTPLFSLRLTGLAAMMIHVALASTGSFGRYEAYLVLTGFLVLLPCMNSLPSLWLAFHKQPWPVRIRIAGIASLTIVVVTIAMLPQVQTQSRMAPGAVNVYEQQVQMARFLDTYYTGATIVANDIGAINAYANIHCLDLAALGSLEPTQAVRAGRWNASFIENWARQEGASVAVVYETWFREVIPESWIKIAEWTVGQRVSAAQATVTWYAITPAHAGPLHENLSEFAKMLPKSVTSTLAVRR